MTKEDRIILKPNKEQRATLEYLKALAGLNGIHGEDQKTIYWGLEVVARVYHLFALDQLLGAKGIQVRDPAQFKSPEYKKVGQNARKRTPWDPPKGALVGYGGPKK